MVTLPTNYLSPTHTRGVSRDWYVIAEQPAPAPHLAHPEGCTAPRIVLVTVSRVSRSCEHFPDGVPNTHNHAQQIRQCRGCSRIRWRARSRGRPVTLKPPTINHLLQPGLSEILSPEPDIRNPKPETYSLESAPSLSNQKSKIWIPKSDNRRPEPDTRSPKPETQPRIPKSEARKQA